MNPPAGTIENERPATAWQDAPDAAAWQDAPAAAAWQDAPGATIETTAPDAAAGTSASAASPQRRSANRLAYVVAGCAVALVALTMLGGLLNVGDHLMAAHPALGWTFYGLLAALAAIGIVVPLVRIAQRPIFSLYQLRDEKGRARQRRCRMLVDNLKANANLADDEVLLLDSYLQAGESADDLLIEFFKAHYVPVIDEATKSTATTAFFISAVSHSPLVSTVTMLSLCLDLVREIVETCGFRPTNMGLGRLYARVMLSALIIGGIEDSDLSDLLGQLMGGGAGARAGGFVLGSAAEGVVSAFLVFRVGVLTKRYLTAEDGPARMANIRRASYREALALMRTSGFMQTVADAAKSAAGTVAASAGRSVANAARSAAHAAKTAILG